MFLLIKAIKSRKQEDIFILVIVIVLFGVFYPITSGMTVSEEYISSLKWLKSWYF